MGDLAPPVNCRLVTSSTGESFSPSPSTKKRLAGFIEVCGEAAPKLDNNNNHDSEVSSSTKDEEIITKPKEIPHKDVVQTTCGSYGSSAVCGPCDTTLTASDDDHGNNTTHVKEEDDEDSFIVVESKRSKAKGRLASTTVTASAKSGKEATTKEHPESFKMAADSSSDAKSNRQRDDAASTGNGSFSAFYQSFPSLKTMIGSKVQSACQQSSNQSMPPPPPPTQAAQHPHPQLSVSKGQAVAHSMRQRSNPNYLSYLPNSGSTVAPSYAAAISNALDGTSKALSVGSTSVSSWHNHYASYSRGNGVHSGPACDVIESGNAMLPHGCNLPGKLSANCDGESNDGTESECGSVSSLSVDGLSRSESVASSSSSCHEEQPGKLFVGSLAASVTEQDLYKYFSQFGEVKSCFIKFDLGTNKSRGFGFVVFREADVINAVMGLNADEKSINSDGIPQTRSHVIHGRPIHVRKAKPIAEMKRIRLKDDYDESQQKRVFIGGVPLEVTEEVIQTHFSKVGPVEKVILIFGTSENENGRHRGIGFVTFAQKQHAEAAIRIRYHAIPEHFCTIECKPAIQKGDKSAPVEPPKATQSGSNLTLADFRHAESTNANYKYMSAGTNNSTASTVSPSSILTSSKTGLLPTPRDAMSADQRQGSSGTYAANCHPPSIEVTPPTSQPWSSKGAHASELFENEDARRSHNRNNGSMDLSYYNSPHDAPTAESRPPSALSLDSGYGGCLRSVSPGSDMESCSYRYNSASFGSSARENESRSFSSAQAGAVDCWSIGQQSSIHVPSSAYAPTDSSKALSTSSAPNAHVANAAIGSVIADSSRSPAPCSAYSEHQLLQSLNHLSIGGGSKYAAVRSSCSSPAFSSPSATPAHLRWFDPRGSHDDQLNIVTLAESAPISFSSTTTTHALPCSSSLGINPYGTQLIFAHANDMEKFISDKFHFSPSARMGAKAESAGAVEGASEKIQRDSAANAAAKYEWNHWNSNGGGLGSVETAPIALEDLPFAPLSRLTFLRDDPMEVRGANGSNGFDVYVR